MDHDESRVGHPSALHDFGHQQRSFSWSLYSLHRWTVAHARGLRADLLFPADRRAQSDLWLSLVGFWSLALFLSLISIIISGPIADWAETIAIVTSMLLIIPVWTVLVNFFGTMKGRWSTFGTNLPASS